MIDIKSQIIRPALDLEDLKVVASAEGWKLTDLRSLHFFLNRSFKYRRKITITEQSGSDLTDYQVLIELNSSNFDFSHAQTNGEDIRFTDASGNLLDYWIEEWDAVNQSAKIWVKVPHVPANGTAEIFMYYGNPELASASNPDETFLFYDDFEGSYKECIFNGDYYEIHKITIDSTTHGNYGLRYPFTLIFQIPSNITNLTCWKSRDGSTWEQLSEKTRDTMECGDECVRFDYDNNVAVVNVAFYPDSDDLYIKFEDGGGNIVEAKLIKIPKYWDDRRSVLVIMIDDIYRSWNNIGANSDTMVDCFRSRGLWMTAAPVTQDTDWDKLQTQVNEGYVEVGSHSRTHPRIPYDDVESEIEGSKQDILNNLTLSDLQGQFVLTYIDPWGECDNDIRNQLGISHYLAERAANVERVSGDYPEKDKSICIFYTNWDSANNLYERTACVTTPWEWEDNLGETFLRCRELGGIYIVYCHPSNYDSAKTPQWADAVSGFEDVWYTGLGFLYEYWLIAERGLITVSGYDGSAWHDISYTPAENNGLVGAVDLTPAAEEPNDLKLKPSKWTVIEDESKFRLSARECSDVQCLFLRDIGTQSGRAYLYVQIPDTSKIALDFRARITDNNYAAISIDDSTLETGAGCGVAISPPVTLFFGQNDMDLYYVSNNSTISIETNDKEWHDYTIAANTTNYIKIVKDGQVKISNKPLNYNADVFRYIQIWLCGGSFTGPGAFFDNIRVRKYTDPEPSISVGDEETS